MASDVCCNQGTKTTQLFVATSTWLCYGERKLLYCMINQLGEVSNTCLSLPGFAATLLRNSYDVRRVDITPLEQRRVTFDTHALVQDLEAHGK